MKVTNEFRDGLLVAVCDSDLAEPAKNLLRLIVQSGEPADSLRDGDVIEFGWAPLMLCAGIDGLVVCEPDFEGDVNQFIPSISRTLRVAVEQNTVLNALGIQGVPAKYKQGVVLKRGVLAIDRIYMHRRKPVNRRDSGWYIGSADYLGEPPDQSQLDAVYVYRLLSVRPALLRVMALPPEYIVVFDADEIEAVVNPSNQRVWPVPEESTPMTKP